MLTAEAYPFVKVGGLGDYAGSLPKVINFQTGSSLAEIDLRVILPFHDELSFPDSGIRKCCDISVPRKDGAAHGTVYETQLDGVHYYLVKRKGNSSGYKAVYNHDPKDDARKFIFFSLASLFFLREIGWQPHIIHANDWHTAAAVKHLADLKKSDKFFSRIKSVLVVHNLPFLGEGSQSELQAYGIRHTHSRLLPDWALSLPFPMGLEAADQIVAVSPSYASELMDEEFSDGLAPFFRANKEKVIGILNGIDTETWDPAADPLIAENFSPDNMDGRIFNKKQTLGQLGFEKSGDQPLLVLISRLTYQKGMDIILQGLPGLIEWPWTAIILGTGQAEYENAFKELEEAYPQRFRFFQEYNDQLAHQLYAAGDIFLMPSLYEPCGLSQMIAMRYGCVPVARAVGGLKDSIQSDDMRKKDGYLFPEAKASAFNSALTLALNDFKDKVKWGAIQSRGMKKDFSWQTSAKKYLDLYFRLSNNNQE
jgi:starch synthase